MKNGVLELGRFKSCTLGRCSFWKMTVDSVASSSSGKYRLSCSLRDPTLGKLELSSIYDKTFWPVLNLSTSSS